MLGGELAVPFSRNPLYAGLNSLLRVWFGTLFFILTDRRATDGYEPRQVRKEAAISNAVCVTDRSRSYIWRMCFRKDSIEGAQPTFLITQLSASRARQPMFIRLWRAPPTDVFPAYDEQSDPSTDDPPSVWILRRDKLHQGSGLVCLWRITLQRPIFTKSRRSWWVWHVILFRKRRLQNRPEIFASVG